MENKKIIFSGIQPSGNLNIGNYIGAISQWVEMQKEYNCIFSVVDYHAITVKQSPEELRKRILEITKIYLAAGINPESSIIFQQSAISAHTELAWILNCYGARISELEKMTQFKDKSGISELKMSGALLKDSFNSSKECLANMENALESINERYKPTEKISDLIKANIDNLKKHVSLIMAGSNLNEQKEKMGNISVGLYDYPVLMAADILLYNTDIVPVGEDQIQHVELARDIAKRFNTEFGNIFTIPKSIIRKDGARIMSLLDPKKKMSKSDINQNNCIGLLDDLEVARKKIMRAVTDSGDEITYDLEDKPALSNLLTIYAILGNREIPRLVKDYKGKGYGEFKKDLADVVIKFLENFQKKYYSISDKDVLKILDDGNNKALVIAQHKLEEVKKLIGVK